ncbi:hypothetical protein OKA05_13880 [Luteolibacter arcticus]|uniref:Uncharacterized protein n=1 Tax=Luteolibacter arcticus TaxID=1581411 RepID=A0ABT3GJE8_9BACT|nr:hypothetical protein [Luteolibacter arcticus]MCW1923650.1 hypothetical protein [Luteolibacter arcticus]
MEVSSLRLKFPAHLASRLMIAGGVAALFSACNRDAAKVENRDKAQAGDAAAAGKQEPARPAEAPGIPPLSQVALDQLMQQCVLVRSKDGRDTPGVVVFEEEISSSGSTRHLIAASTSPESDTIRLAYASTKGRVAISSGTRELVLPNGLSLYSTTAKVPFIPGKTGPEEGPVHACRLRGSGSIDPKEKAELEAKLAPLRKQSEELTAKQHEAMRDPGMDRVSREQAMRQSSEIAMQRARLSREMSQLTNRLALPIDSMSGEEVGSASTVEAMDKSSIAMEGTVLASKDGTVTAIRHEGKWIDTEEMMPADLAAPAGITLSISGSQRDVRVNCEIEWTQPIGKPACSMVAATTYELESIQGADIAERLTKVEARKLSSSKEKSSGSSNCEWNGKPTSLWIRIFKDTDPAHPIIDEMVQLDYPDQFVARWGKPPSPLIKHKASQQDKPADLLRETSVVAAQGTILDMIAAGDGSVLIVRTDRPPYWAPFDLKTGRFEEAPWKAGPDTLLAAQAGKVYLIDRKSKVLEIWDLASKKKTGLQLLAMEGDLVAAAAPLSSAISPLLVTSDKTARFFDPVQFDPLANGLAIDACFAAEKTRDHELPRLDPSSVHLRASGDGALYVLYGDPAGSQRSNPVMIPIEVDSSLLAITRNSNPGFLASRGRQVSRDYPDHGGSDLELRPRASQKPFPSPPGMIRFMDGENREAIAEMWSLPVAPSESSKSAGPLPRDRELYFDSSHDILLAPDGDKLHVMRLNLPKRSQAAPDFAFTGEEIQIPLPPGRDHKLVSDSGQEKAGETVIEGNLAKWKVPENFSSSSVNLTLEWTAELGSTMSRPIQRRIAKQSPRPFIESPDGKARLPLRRTGVISTQDEIRGFAGSGEILLTHSGDTYGAWNLSTCERLLDIQEDGRSIFGDADQLYILKDNDTLKSFDLRTGAALKEVSFGNAAERREGLAGITTGISARGPLLAVEKDHMNRYLALVDRKTLESRLLNFPRETQQLFFIPQFTANPSGSAIWSFTAGVFWENNNTKITATSFPNTPISGTPDASGRYVVGSGGILDLKASPPVITKTSEIRGGAESMECSLDVSGQYLLLTDSSSRPGQAVISVREVAKSGEEIFKLIIPADYLRSSHVISGIQKLITPLSDSPRSIGVFHFDVPALAVKLAAGAVEP